ncbi:MAG TPA: SusD/RagB family nutrient-binding outer membrane lipoprotein [Puia sp.]|nr:SusD/RagB family nutrient-binding outer membrane lipoprotein [Puia sp.]
MRNLSILCLLAVMVSSCTKNIQNLNINTKAAVSVPATALFLAGEKNLSDNYTTTSIGVMPFRVFSQTWTETTYTTEARYILSAYNAPDNLWAAMYSSILNNLTDAKAAFPTTVKDPGTLRNDLIITDILEVYAYDILVVTYGNIPYSQAESRTIPYPKYDDAKTVYLDLLTRLDTCIAGLSAATTSASMGAADQVYKGNIAKWKKFAATLKLKMAMLLADTDPSTAGKKVQEAVATGVFTANTDNAQVTYQSSPTGNTNPIWQAVINSGRHDFCPGGLLVTTMNNWNDPRLPLYWTKATDGTYKGGVAGASNSAPLLSTFSAQWTAATYPSDLLDYAETEFLLAEAVERGFLTGGNTAEQYYDAGVTASITFWGGSAGDAAAYLAQPAVAYTTAAGDYKQKIGYQKWIAEVNRGWDAWTDIRRLGQPNIDAVSPPIGAITTMPKRFYYPLKEQTANPANWSAAAKTINGGDVVTSKLFWMP